MRTLYLFLLLSVIAPGAIAAGDVTQVSFTSSTPTVANIQIPNLDRVRSIYTAGSYAWATDNTKAAFYDGKQWQPGVSLPDATSIDGIYPAYPVTGKTSEAWAQVETHNGAGISYFDGTQWHKPDLIKTILGVDTTQFNVATSGGAIVVIGQLHYDDNKSYYSIKSSTSSAWVQHSITGVLYASDPIFDMFDDNQPVLNFVIYDRQPNVLLLYRVALNGNNAGTALPESNAIPKKPTMTDPYILADGSHVFTIYEKLDNILKDYGYQMLGFKDFSNQNGWQYTQSSHEAKIVTWYEGSTDSEYDGLFCNPLTARIKPQKIFSCLDTKASNPRWHKIPLTEINTQNDREDTGLLAKSGGAWIMRSHRSFSKGTTDTHIYDYNYKTNSLTDLQWPNNLLVTNYARGSLVEIGKTGLLVCIASPKNIQLYYYNHQGWQTLDMGKTQISGCAFSMAGTPAHNTLRVASGGNLWVYNTSYEGT